jgi:hypothetical protein
MSLSATNDWFTFLPWWRKYQVNLHIITLQKPLIFKDTPIQIVKWLHFIGWGEIWILVGPNEFSAYIKWGKVQQSHYRPVQALRVPGGWGSQISRQSAHEGGKVISHTHRPPLPPRKYSSYSFLLEAESTPVRPNGLCQWKIPMTPSGIQPAPFHIKWGKKLIITIVLSNGLFR